MPAFSVIVPIYNAEKTLHRCLTSLRQQSFSDFEVLMIENASSDSSGTICKEYTAKDPRFILYACEENKGPSGARNIGLDRASGTYIAFLDSDDYVEPDYLESLLEAFQNSDVVFFGYHQISIDGTFLGDHIPQIEVNTGYYGALIALYEQDLFGYTWIKAFRREVIGSHRFFEELNLLEDEVFACEALTEPKRIHVLPRAILNYVTGNTGSLVGRTHPDYCRKVDTAYGAWKKLLQRYEKRDDVLARMADIHVLRCMYYGFERDVDPDDFFRDLAQCEFFADSNPETVFYLSVKTGNLRKLRQMRSTYRLKVAVSNLLKR